MRFSFLFTAAVIAAAATTQSFGAPTTTTPGPSETETYPLQRPVTPRMKYENLNHIVVRANDAVERLDKALSSAISGGKIDASLGPAEKGLGLLAMYLEDAKQGLVNGSIKINNPSQIYGSVLTLKTNVKVVADKVAGLKSVFDKLQFSPIIATVLQALAVSFDGFFHALDAKLNKNKVPDCISVPVLDIVCSLDSVITALDPKSALTQGDFCKKPSKTNACPALKPLPKKLPGLKAAHNDVRLYLLAAYPGSASSPESAPNWKSDKKKQLPSN